MATPLPLPATPFVGRGRELEELLALLSNPQVRLVTVLGMGGMGKTRLALEIAQRAQALFTDGVVFVPLAAINSAEQMAPAICAALKVSTAQEDFAGQLAGLVAALRSKALLLVLDNLEHLLTSAEADRTTEIIATLLAQSSQVTVLVTSREAVRLKQEQVYRLDGLDSEDASEAVALFVQSAGHAQANFALGAIDEAVVQRICRLVGGMPLGIELAAAWVNMLSLEEIAAEIERGLDLLTTTDRDTPARQRSIHAILEQSWQLLTPQERSVLEQLAVFRGSFTREMAAQVASASLMTLAQLVAKALLRRSENNRYDLHELMRQAAYHRLTASGQATATHERHLQSYLAYAEGIAQRFYGPEAARLAQQLALDLGNLRAALAWSCDPTRPGDDNMSGLRLANALARFYYVLPNWREGYDWLQRTAAHAGAVIPPVLAAHTQLNLGLFTHAWAARQAAISHFEAALALFQQLPADDYNARWYTAWTLAQLVQGHSDAGRLAKAEALARESLERFRQLGDEWAIGVVTWQLGHVMRGHQDYTQAALLVQEAFTIFQRLDDRVCLALAVSLQGDLAKHQGDFARAEQHYLTGLTLCRSNGAQEGTAWMMQIIGEVALAQQAFDRALFYLTEGLALRAKLGHEYAIWETLQALAILFTQCGRDPLAARLFGAAARDSRGDALLLGALFRPAYTDTREALQARLTAAEWAAAWNSGQITPVQDLIAEIRAEANAEEPAAGAPRSEGPTKSLGGATQPELKDLAHPQLAAQIVRTRLQPPRRRDDILRRGRLTDAIRAAIGNLRLVLLAAPAGFGKSTLLADTLHSTTDAQIAWLTVEHEDDDLLRFLQVWSAALQTLLPTWPETAATLLNDEAMGTPHDSRQAAYATMSALVNELFELAGPVALILDDLHQVTDSAIYSILDFLLERLPPHVTLMVSTRHDPPLALAQLRARRELLEIRLEELRFRVDEATALLNQQSRLPLAPADIAILLQRAEGWPAGLTLLATSLARLSDESARDAFLHQLVQSNQYIFDYLADTVLRREDDATRDFLLATAVLAELTPALCAAVSGRTDADQLLADLQRRNLFVVEVTATDDPSGPPVYRYHDLFRAFLHEQLRQVPPAQLQEWHRRAALAVTDPARRFEHYGQAQLWSEAAATLAESGEALLARYAPATVQSWIEALPAAMRSTQPRLLYLLGLCAWRMRWDTNTAVRWLTAAAEQFHQQGDLAGAGEALTAAAVACSTNHEMTRAREFSNQAMMLPIADHWRVKLLLERAYRAAASGDWQGANQDLDEALTLAEQANDPRALHFVAEDLRPSLCVMPGGLLRIDRFRRLITTHSGAQETLVQAAAAVLGAWAAIWRDQWTEASAAGDHALQLAESGGGLVLVKASVYIQQPICAAMGGEWERAEREINRLLTELAQPNLWSRSRLLAYLFPVARVRWEQEQWAALQSLYHQMGEHQPPNESATNVLLRQETQALLFLSENKTCEAISLLAQVVAGQEQLPMYKIFGDARLTLAYAQWRAGQAEAALITLAPVLEEHEREGTPGRLRWQGPRMVAPLLQLAVDRGIYTRLAGQLLATLPAYATVTTPPLPAVISPDNFRIPDTGEVLTARELDVLHLIAQGVDNPTIATELVVSIHTVKTHVAHILGKMGVASRTAAAIKAKELGLVK
ncbi:MAG: LuxR C-terminal-related transcriptional regulator [Caldilineaceae bacterium]